MFLQTLQVEGFRSLKSVTWKPGRLNVLIGPNGGGKSNLLKALDLIRIAATGGLREEIIRKLGGMEPLVWDGVAQRIRFKLGVKQEPGLVIFDYMFSLERLGADGGYEIGEEELARSGALRSLGGPTSDGVVFRRRSVLSIGKLMQKPLHVSELLPNEPTSSTEVILARHPETSALRRTLEGWGIFGDVRTDQSAELRRATPTSYETRVEPDGRNLIAVLHTQYLSDRRFEESIDNAMAAAFPDDYEKLLFPPAEDGRIQLRVRRKHRKRNDRAADLSDGTLRFLLMATILGSPDPAPLIAIDEPETGLHPRMLPIIAAMAENAALKTQVIFTTHSPEFLDAFRDEPPTVTVVTTDGAETKLANIEGDELKRWLKEYSLGRFAFSGAAEAIT